MSRDQHDCMRQLRPWCAHAQGTAAMTRISTATPMLAGYAGFGALGQPQLLGTAMAALGGAAIGALAEHEHDKHHHQG